MITTELLRCRDVLSAQAAAVERSARALGEGLVAMPGVSAAALAHLQVNDLTVQRALHCRDALDGLAGLEDPVLAALGCRLQARQLAPAGAELGIAATALLAEAPGLSAAGLALRDAAGRLEALAAALETLADAAPPPAHAAAALRAEVVERLRPAYTMAAERTILARFLAGETAAPASEAPAADDDDDDDTAAFFL